MTIHAESQPNDSSGRGGVGAVEIGIGRESVGMDTATVQCRDFWVCRSCGINRTETVEGYCLACDSKEAKANLQARHGEGLPLLAVQGRSGLERFVAEFEPLLGTSPRWEGLKYIVADQLARESVGIIETGTCRKPGDWVGDGNATRVWDWILGCKAGVGVSVDVEMSSVETAQKVAPRMHCVCQDSVSFLRGYVGFAPTLVYLDSRDWGPGAEVSSCMHQVAELAAIWERIPSGCLIASDDSHNMQQGKPVLTRQLLRILDIEPVLESYIVVWKR